LAPVDAQGITAQVPVNATTYYGMIDDAKRALLFELLNGDLGELDPATGRRPDRGALGWELTSSVFFIMTLVATIGYGNVSPMTPGGRVFVALFCWAGIGYFGYTLALVCDRIIELVVKQEKTRQIRLAREAGERPDPRVPTLLLVKRLATLSGAYVVVLSLAGPIFASWRYIDSIYFAVLTFATVGLGDVAPYFDSGRPGWYRSLAYFVFAVFTLVGMALLASFIGAVAKLLDDLHVRRREAKGAAAEAVRQQAREEAARARAEEARRKRRRKKKRNKSAVLVDP
jgi:hypothetical protein